MNAKILLLQILFRSEYALFKAEAKRNKTSLVLYGAAVGCLLIAVLALNATIFFYYTEMHLHAKGGLFLCILNILIATIPIYLAKGLKITPEEEKIEEIKNLASTELKKEASKIEEEIKSVVASVSTFKSNIETLKSSSLDTSSTILALMIDLVKKLK